MGGGGLDLAIEQFSNCAFRTQPCLQTQLSTEIEPALQMRVDMAWARGSEVLLIRVPLPLL